MMGLAFSLVPFLLCLLLMHVLMPKAVLDRYWKEPHFRPFELMLFSGWSLFAPMRTIMFMWMFLFPGAGRRRRILEPHRLVPQWYRIAAIVMDVWGIILSVGIIGILLGFYIYFLVVGDPKKNWDVHLGMAVVIACFVFVAVRQRYVNRRGDRTKQRNKDKPA